MVADGGQIGEALEGAAGLATAAVEEEVAKEDAEEVRDEADLAQLLPFMAQRRELVGFFEVIAQENCQSHLQGCRLSIILVKPRFSLYPTAS